MAGLKINKQTTKKKMTKNKQTLMAIIVLLVAVLGVMTINNILLRQEVEIVVLKTAVPQEGRITSANIEKGVMTKAELDARGTYKSADGTVKAAIVPWSERGTIENAYASYYLRENTPIYWDSLSKETPKKYSYLYKMDGELLKVDIEADQFGRMLVPGDHVNIRIAYDENIGTLMNTDEYNTMKVTGVSPQTTGTMQTKLFNNVAILDILNDDGESIFDLYYELLALPKSQQQELINDEDFRERVLPVQILLNVTPEEADYYMSVMRKNPTMLMTLLPRTGSNLITEALNDLETGFARNN